MPQRFMNAFEQATEEAALESQQQEEAAAVELVDETLEPGLPISDEAAANVLEGVDIDAEDPHLQLSMEAEIKELRNGMKVKFSHGHGKIAKIYTGPFLLDKKHHKASKDAPLYLVRHDKGGKHSLHKASALKLVK